MNEELPPPLLLFRLLLGGGGGGGCVALEADAGEVVASALVAAFADVFTYRVAQIASRNEREIFWNGFNFQRVFVRERCAAKG